MRAPWFGWVLMALNLGCAVALGLSAHGRGGDESFAQGILATLALGNVIKFLEKKL